MKKNQKQIIGCVMGLLAMVLLSIMPATAATPVTIASYTGPTNQYYYAGYPNGAYAEQSVGQSFVIPQAPVGNHCIIKQISIKLCKLSTGSYPYVNLQVWRVNCNGIPYQSPAVSVYVPACSIPQENPLPIPVVTITIPWNIQLLPGHYAFVLVTHNIQIVTEGKNCGNPYACGTLLTKANYNQPWVIYPMADLYFAVTAEYV